MENTKENTMSGGAAQNQIVRPGAAENLKTSAVNVKSVTRKGVPLGTLEERRQILQDAAMNYQKAGGKVIVHYNGATDTLVIVLPETGECMSCGMWISGNGDGCPKCSGKAK